MYICSVDVNGPVIYIYIYIYMQSRQAISTVANVFNVFTSPDAGPLLPIVIVLQ